MPKLIGSNKDSSDCGDDNDYDLIRTTTEPQKEKEPPVLEKEGEIEQDTESESEKPEPEYYTPSSDFRKDCEDMPKLIGQKDDCDN